MNTRHLIYGAAIVAILWVMLVTHVLINVARLTGEQIPILRELIPTWPTRHLNEMPHGSIDPMTLGEPR